MNEQEKQILLDSYFEACYNLLRATVLKMEGKEQAQLYINESAYHLLVIEGMFNLN